MLGGLIVLGVAQLATVVLLGWAVVVFRGALAAELDRSERERHQLWERIQRPDRVPLVSTATVPADPRPEGAWAPGDPVPQSAEDVIKLALAQSGGDASALSDDEFAVMFRTDEEA